MKKLTDEEIQQLLDQHLPIDITSIPEESKNDLQSYQLLFDALDQQQAIKIPAAFVSKITAQIHASNHRRSDLKLFVLLAAFLFVFAAATVVYLSTATTIESSIILQVGLKYKFPLLFGIVMLVLIKFADLKIFSPDLHLPAAGNPA